MNPDAQATETRVQRWEAASEWPLTATAVIFLIAYAWPILDVRLSPAIKDVLRFIDLAAWAIFVVDYCARLLLAQRRWHYWSRHLLDLAIIALPVLRPMRLLRLILLLKALNRGAIDTLRGRMAIYVAGGTILLLVCGSLAVLDAERGHPGANIQSYGDALWWSIVTISTVGYGDHYPVTTEGRLVALGLILGGVALLGVVTASIAAWLVENVRATEHDEQSATRADVAALSAHIEELHQMLAALHTTDPEPR